MGKNNPLLVAAVVIAAIYFLGPSLLGGTTTTPPPDDGVECTSTTTPNVDFICRDIDNKGTAVTCTTHYKLNGGSIQTDADGTGIALDVGDQVEYFVNSTGWYGVHSTYTVPCKEEPDVFIDMKDYATSPVLQLYQEDDGLLISSTATEKVEQGDQPTLKTILYADTEDYIQGALFFCDADRTYTDDIYFDGATGDGSYDWVSHYDPISGTDDHECVACDKLYGAWSLGDMHGTSPAEYGLTIDLDDNQASPGGAANVTCYIVDQDWFINEDDGTFEYGLVDENDANVGQDDHLFNVTAFTAAS